MGAIVGLADVALIVFGSWTMVQYRDVTSQRAASYQSVAAVDSTLISLLDVETGQRGFLITGDPAFLQPYNTGVDELGAKLDDLRLKLAAQPDELSKLSGLTQLVEVYRAELQRAIDVRGASNANPSATAALAREAKATMDSMRATLASTRRVEAAQLSDRSDRADKLGFVVGITAIALGAATLAILVWLFVVVKDHHEAETIRGVAQAKEEFVGFISHELRSPMAVILGNANFLADGGPADPAARRAATREILDAGTRIITIVDTLLNLARAEKGVPLDAEPVLVHHIARKVAERHTATFPDRTIEIATDEEPPTALADPHAVEQIFLNLLTNAEKYGAADTPILIQIVRRVDAVRTTVSNEGPLLDPEEFEQIFEPFFRLSGSAETTEGIGLGLTICHRLVVAQDGRMAAEVRPEGGASFSFTLPAAPDED